MRHTCQCTLCFAHAVVACTFALVVAGQRAQAQPGKSLVIGIDGLGSYGLYAAATPRIDSLIDGTFGGGAYHGSFTPHAYAGGVVDTATQQPTVSGPGWSTILTGVWADRHLVTNNSFSPRDFDNHPPYLKTLEVGLPSVYTASVVNWAPIDTYVIDAVDVGGTSMDFRSTPGNDVNVTNVVTAQLAALESDQPAAVFVQFDDVDGAGHSSGTYSQGYLDEIADTDAHVGALLDAITARPNFADENWQIIITADHGHRTGGGHGGQTALERTVPLIVTSKIAAQGWMPVDDDRPSQADVAPTATRHTGLIPSSDVVGKIRGRAALSPTSTLIDGLVAHLPLDGTVAAGLAGSDAIAVGDLSYTEGRFGQAVTVENYGDGYVRLADDLAADWGNDVDFSVSLWIKQDGFNSDPAFLSNKDWASGNNTGINLALNPDNTLDFNTKGGSGARADLHPYALFRPGIWQNIVFTVDRDGPTTLFVDGRLAGELESTSIGSFDGAANFALLNDGIGDYGFNSTTTGLMIDEFAAWDRLLTLDEISSLAMAALTAPLLADGNGDGLVDGLDYLIWADHYGEQPATPMGASDGDYNGDDRVDGLDYLVWADRFGQVGEAVAAPEPGCVSPLIAVTLLAAITRRASRRRL
ncbi:MAG: LamG-like jellyroll fold domain-containing protein [Pirellulales bacterium]